MAMNPLYMNEELEVTEESKPHFRVTDLASLNWTMRKLVAIEAKKREISELVRVEIERYERFYDESTKGLTESENFFKSLISEYAAQKREEDPKFKTEKTPFGSIGFRKQQPRWLYDEDLLIAYLEQNAYTDLIRTKKEPVKTEIKKSFQVGSNGRVYDNDGQLVEGITVEPQPDTLDIKVSEV